MGIAGSVGSPSPRKLAADGDLAKDSGQHHDMDLEHHRLQQSLPARPFLRVKVDGGTLKQGSTVLTWDSHGYYEVALDAGTLSLSNRRSRRSAVTGTRAPPLVKGWATPARGDDQRPASAW